MRAVSTQEQAIDWRFVARPVEQRAHGEELIESEFSVEDLASSEAVRFLEVFGRDDLVAEDGLGQIRRILGDGFHNRFTERLALSFPVAVLQIIGGVLHVDRHHLLSIYMPYAPYNLKHS